MTLYCIVAVFIQNTGSALHGKYRNKNKYKMLTQREGRMENGKKERNKYTQRKGRRYIISFASL